MNKNSPRREISDAVDIWIEDNNTVETNNIQEISVNLLESYHNHPFNLYVGKRLDDMVESIKESGILNPVIVIKKENGMYEILSGHNRVNAARLAKLENVPCIIKENLTEEQEYTYVIETNLMQRSFSDLLPSEKAAVLKVKYEKIANQGKRNDLQKEINKLDDGVIKEKNFSNSRDVLATEYSLSGSSIARFLRLN